MPNLIELGMSLLPQAQDDVFRVMDLLICTHGDKFTSLEFEACELELTEFVEYELN